GGESALLGDRDRAAGSEAGSLVRRRRADGVRVEHHRPSALRRVADLADVARVVAERKLLLRRPPRLFEVRERLEQNRDALGTLHMRSGRMQAREVAMADERRYHAAGTISGATTRRGRRQLAASWRRR